MKNKIDKEKHDTMIFDGEKLPPEIVFERILKETKQKIYIIKNQIDLKTLEWCKNIPSTIEVTIFSDNFGKGLSLLKLNDFKLQNPDINLNFRITNGKFKSYYLILDQGTNNEAIFNFHTFHKGTKNEINALIRFSDLDIFQNMINELLESPQLILK